MGLLSDRVAAANLEVEAGRGSFWLHLPRRYTRRGMARVWLFKRRPTTAAVSDLPTCIHSK